ncbi:MAG: hypothetical protein NPINA01_19230 [Nitrospinaceae bacterium]|nr:MAG: hypothetical protein NPINA01_19230 [Nitrospinaceae bacterium]
MHAVYKAVSIEDVERVIDYCREHTINSGGLFEVYPSPDCNMTMMVVNSGSADDSENSLRPLGAFYCNFVAPGVISIEEEDPHFDGVDSRKRHVKAIKQVIDILLDRGYPGAKISFNDLPALKD